MENGAGVGVGWGEGSSGSGEPSLGALGTQTPRHIRDGHAGLMGEAEEGERQAGEGGRAEDKSEFACGRDRGHEEMFVG